MKFFETGLLGGCEGIKTNGHGFENSQHLEVVALVIVHIGIDELLDRVHLFESVAIVELGAFRQ